jgi:hypothetical protein
MACIVWPVSYGLYRMACEESQGYRLLYPNIKKIRYNINKEVYKRISPLGVYEGSTSRTI